MYDHDDDDFNRPSLTFGRLTKTARRPEPFTNTDNSFAIHATKAIYSLTRGEQVSTGLHVTVPEGFVLVVQQHPFAMGKGVFATSPYPITHLHEGELLLTVYMPWWEKPDLFRRQLLIDVGQPFAIVTLVAAPACNAYFEGWGENSVKGWESSP